MYAYKVTIYRMSGSEPAILQDKVIADDVPVNQSDGTWQYDGTLEAGSYYIYAVSYDLAGNISHVSDVKLIRVEPDCIVCADGEALLCADGEALLATGVR